MCVLRVAHEFQRAMTSALVFRDCFDTISPLYFSTKYENKKCFALFHSCDFYFARYFSMFVYLERCLTGIGDSKCTLIAQFINRNMCVR